SEGEYFIFWHSIVQCAMDSKSGVTASRFAYVNDWRRVENMDAAIAIPSATAIPIPLPDSLSITANESPDLVLFHGRKTPASSAPHDNGRLVTYHDDTRLPLPMVRLQGAHTESAPQSGALLPVCLTVGILLLAIGLGMLAFEAGLRTRDSGQLTATGTVLPARVPSASSRPTHLTTIPSPNVVETTTHGLLTPRRTLALLCVLSLAYILLFVPPNLLGTKDCNMLAAGDCV